MTNHVLHAIDITAPLLIASAPEALTQVTPNDVTEVLRWVAYCLSIVYAIVKLWKHYKPTDNESNDTPPSI